MGNFKQLCSHLGNKQLLHLNLHRIRSIWANFNTLYQIWVIKQLHSNLGAIGTIWADWKSFILICIYYKYLGKLQQPKQIWANLRQPH